MRAKIIAAMDAAGYSFDQLESADDNLRFFGDYGHVMHMGSWQEAKEWLEGVVFYNPDVSDRVEKILHPERFKSDRSSVLKRLKEKQQKTAAVAREANPTVKRSRSAEER